MVHLLCVLSFQVLLVSLVLRVLTAGPAPQVSLELPVDQESLADQELQGCQEKRVRQVGTGSQDQLESKESQVSHCSACNVFGRCCLTIHFVYSILFKSHSLNF